jgi:hypothetical protein
MKLTRQYGVLHATPFPPIKIVFDNHQYRYVDTTDIPATGPGSFWGSHTVGPRFDTQEEITRDLPRYAAQFGCNPNYCPQGADEILTMAIQALVAVSDAKDLDAAQTAAAKALNRIREIQEVTK